MEWIIEIVEKFGIVASVLLATLFAIWKMGNKIYDNMSSTQLNAMTDQKKLYDRILDDAKLREERLMRHQTEQSNINREVSETLKSINNWMCNIDSRIEHLENNDMNYN